MELTEKKYLESLEWLYSRLPMFSRVGAAAYKPGLEMTETLDVFFRHPHRHFRSIHIGGTNGKGSTSHMIASVLQNQGYKTGLYTSPHLTDFRERMRINGKMIPKDMVCEFVEEWRASKFDGRPSFFELTMMMAFQWFAREKVDFAVIEVGMGGRLDSTNIINPLLSIITNISKDHTQFLGESVEKIAFEKAGIIKKDIPVVIGEANGKIKDIFLKKAAEEGSPIHFAENIANELSLQYSDKNGWEGKLSNGSPFAVGLHGAYQKKNIATVIQSLYILRNNGIEISDENITEGLKRVVSNTGLRGRWQIVMDQPKVICDTGHNIAGITENLKTLGCHYPDSNIKFVIGFVNDKDVAGIVRLFPKDNDYYFCQADIPRAMEAVKVAKHFEDFGIKGRVIPSVSEAFAEALRNSSSNDVIYIGGSTFVVADFLKSIP